jgi:ubiquinone/menaquinone biosynthesis C-methylase UbiE
MIDSNNKYTKMQQERYDRDSASWSLEDRNWVVGSFEEHNKYPYDKYLFDGLNTKEMIALDFGCGPGRNIVRFWNIFKRIDGVDIALENLDNTKTWMEHNKINVNENNLYHCNGVDLNNIKDNQYDIIFSTIAMQHIAVHEIRLNYFKEFLRVLRPGGIISIQMAYSPDYLPKTQYHLDHSTDYYNNYYDAIGTNGVMDVRVESDSQLKTDLEKCGFINFSCLKMEHEGLDMCPLWIFFRAENT